MLALWSASAYVGAFGRAMNRIYEIGEGRPFWKLRPLMLLITLIAVVLVAAGAADADRLRAAGRVDRRRGRAGRQTVQVWDIVKWPIIVLVVIVIVALLYYATPNVKQPKFRWISVGAAVAIVIWIVASVGFAFYVANFSSYNKTYGSLAGVVVSADLPVADQRRAAARRRDRLRARARPPAPGRAWRPSEELQLPARDTRNIEKAVEQEDKDAAAGRRDPPGGREIEGQRQESEGRAS